jgi:endonuclease/exonuclease/phosphatase family metal-dependent hydrolase
MSKAERDETSVRVATLNLWGEQPPFERRMALCQRQLAELHLDVVALQEVRELPTIPNMAATLAKGLGMNWVFAPAVEWGGGVEGVALLSRMPIVSSGHIELPRATRDERRVLLWALLETPHGPLRCYSTHLNYRLAQGDFREEQVAAIDRELRGQEAALKVLMGDFNAVPESDEIRYLRGLHSIEGRRAYYQDAFGKLHPGEPGYTWSRLNPYTQRLRWLEADRRLDYIFVSPMTREGRGIIHECRIVCDVPDGEGAFPSDHFGVMAEVQLAPLPPQ